MTTTSYSILYVAKLPVDYKMNALEVERLVITASLVAAGAITFYCPCGDATSGRGLLSCHIQEVSALIAMASLTVLWANR